MSLRLGTKIVAGNAVVVPENIYIKTTYDGGTSGYRIWSDGYCEQWGLANAGTTSITFAKTFKDTNYNILITERGNWAGYIPRVDTVSTNSMTLKFDAFTGGSVQSWYWTVKGYLASGQY